MCDQFGVIFDMDGVLVDSYQPHFVSWEETARRFGLRLTEEQFRESFGQTSSSIIHQLWGEGALTPEQIAEFDRIKEACYRELIAPRPPIMPGAEELVERLSSEGFLLAVGSSGPPENVFLVQEALKAFCSFSAVVTGRDVHRGKPDPEVFLLASERLRLPAKRCLVIEDAPVGMKAAKGAGMRCIGLQSPPPRARDLSSADRVVDRLDWISCDGIRNLLEL